MTKNCSGIYRISFSQDDGTKRYYIGQAKVIRRRRNHHLRGLRRHAHKNWALPDDFCKYGESCFVFEVLIVCECKKDTLDMYEQIILNSYDFCELYNVHLACVGSKLGVVMSAATRAKIGAANKGLVRTAETRLSLSLAAKGRPPQTEERRQKLSERMKGNQYCTGLKLTAARKAEIGLFFKGKKREPDVVQRMLATRAANGGMSAAGRQAVAVANRARNIGKKHSEEHKAKIGAASRGRVPTEETRAKLSAAMKGRIITPEARMKISASLTGQVISPERRAKISATNLKRPPPSAEICAKISAAKMGHSVSPETRAKISATKRARKDGDHQQTQQTRGSAD